MANLYSSLQIAADCMAHSQGRFVGWDGLTRTVRAWLARQEHDSRVEWCRQPR
jgi:hypothetical protein